MHTDVLGHAPEQGLIVRPMWRGNEFTGDGNRECTSSRTRLLARQHGHALGSQAMCALDAATAGCCMGTNAAVVALAAIKVMSDDVQAVCSFIPRQLSIASMTPSVLFFHGLSGLENACDDGLVQECVFRATVMPDLTQSHVLTGPVC